MHDMTAPSSVSRERKHPKRKMHLPPCRLATTVLTAALCQVVLLLSLYGSPVVTSFAPARPLLVSFRGRHTHSGVRRDADTDTEEMATAQTIVDFAYDAGVILSLNSMGPGYRAVARARHNDTQIIGYVSGFLRPGGKILHLDKMEVFKQALTTAREENPDGFKGGGSVFGVGLLLGCLCLRHGVDNGCSVAEFLAIDDNDFQHKRLVRHYRRLGLNVIRYVGEDIANIPDRLIWGGVGTLMNADIQPLLARWTPTFVVKKEEEGRTDVD